MQKGENAGGVVGIEISGGLVGQQEGGAVNQSPRHGRALHLAAAHLVRKSACPVRQASQVEHFQGPAARLACAIPAQEKGEFHVLRRSHGREQVEKLEDHPQAVAAVGGESRFACLVQTQPVDRDLPRGGLVETSQKIEQCALAATARTGHGGEGPRFDFERHVAQSVHFARVGLVYSGNMAEPDHAKNEGFRAERLAQDNFRVVAEGTDWIAVDKPAGLLTHPTRPDGAPTLWDGLRALLAYELANRGQLSIITRLDRETSGLVLLALTSARARALGLAMQKGAIGKEYLAIVHGTPDWDEMTIDAPIIRQGEVLSSKIWLKRCVHERGAAARTELRVERRWQCGGRDMALIRARPLTGRTHQIRVHLAHCGFPVVGDKIYGTREGAYLEFIRTGWTAGLARELLLPRHALHAVSLSFEAGGGRRTLSVGIPCDMEALLRGVDPCGADGFGG